MRPSRGLPLSGVSSRQIARLRYCEEISLDASAVSVAGFDFHANGLYDPNKTGGGHQPQGFDRLMDLYDHYYVLSAKITVLPVFNGQSNVNPGVWGILVTDKANAHATFSNVTHLLESKQFNSVPQFHGLLNSHLVPKSKSRKLSIKKFIGKSPISDDNRGSNAANPQEDIFFNVFAAPIGSNDPGALNFIVRIDYIALFTELKQQPQS